MPLITFDVGGIGEMLEFAEHGDVIVMESTAKALSQKLQGDSPCSLGGILCRLNILKPSWDTTCTLE